eukprot:3756814-Prymnesium_polylepis.1
MPNTTLSKCWTACKKPLYSVSGWSTAADAERCKGTSRMASPPALVSTASGTVSGAPGARRALPARDTPRTVGTTVVAHIGLGRRPALRAVCSGGSRTSSESSVRGGLVSAARPARRSAAIPDDDPDHSSKGHSLRYRPRMVCA